MKKIITLIYVGCLTAIILFGNMYNTYYYNSSHPEPTFSPVTNQIILHPELAINKLGFTNKYIHHAEDISVILNADILTTVVHPQEWKEGPDSEHRYDVSICSGFVYSGIKTEQVIITAKHCVADENEEDMFGNKIHEHLIPRTVHYFNGDVAKITNVYKSDKYDVAVLEVHSMRSHNIKTTFNTIPIYRGEPLFVLGMANGYPWSYSQATPMQGVQEFPANPPFNNLTMIDCDSCYFGDSGAGVFDYQGNVVGLFTAIQGGPSEGLMVSSSHLTEVLKSIL